MKPYAPRHVRVSHTWLWWMTFTLLRRKGESIVRAYREAQKATAKVYQ